ncbi:MAG TPA: SGNH/GDSL hydrolase family protein, partial [Roseiarcus sp.]|nr:SGNH/GDSL hydrolase family protein [Roseiarcus sp.]
TANNQQFNSRSYHKAAVAVSALKIVVPNWYVSNPGFVETAAPTTATIWAAIEYPAGTFHQITFSGSASVTMSAGAQAISDWCNVSIPAGAFFYIRMFGSNSAGVLYITSTVGGTNDENSGVGEALQVAPSGLSNLTMTGSVPESNTYQYGFRPLAILGMTSKPSVLCIGDSRCYGVGDVSDATGDRGEICRSIGQKFAYCNFGVPADKAATFVASNSLRLAFAQYATHIVSEYGVNDMYVLGHAATATLASLAQARALFPGAPFFQSTISPVTSSTDGWATTTNQTANGNVGPNLAAVNDAIRAGNGGITGYFDIADQTMSARDSLLWSVGGGAHTADGLHANALGYAAILNSGAVNVSRIHR